MSGYYRVIRGATASGALGTISMDQSDAVAASIPETTINISARSLINNGNGQVSGRDESSGSIITAVGTNSNWTKVAQTAHMNNQTSIAVAANGNGLRLEAKPSVVISPSFTVIIVCSFTAAAIANTTGASQLFSRIGADNSTLKMSIRRTGASLLFTPNQTATTSLVSVPMSSFTADTPYVLAFQFNNETHNGKIYRNSMSSPIAQETNAAVSSDIAAGDHYEANYGGNGNVGAIFGNYAKFYVINKAITDNQFGMSQAERLFAALRAQYGAV